VFRGWNAKLFKDEFEIGYVQEVRVDIDESLEAYFEAGNRIANRFIEGPLNITGRFSRAWINTDYISLIIGSGPLTEFDLAIEVNTSMTLYLYDCKFKKGSVGIPQDGVLTEDYDFVATSVGIA